MNRSTTREHTTPFRRSVASRIRATLAISPLPVRDCLFMYGIARFRLTHDEVYFPQGGEASRPWSNTSPMAPVVQSREALKITELELVYRLSTNIYSAQKFSHRGEQIRIHCSQSVQNLDISVGRGISLSHAFYSYLHPHIQVTPAGKRIFFIYQLKL
jgi:hypothetical protein